jgi:hypothetical protein
VSKQQFIYELTVLGSLNNLIAMCPCSSDIIKHVIIRCLVIEVMKHHEVLEILFCPYCKITRNQASRDFNYRWPARDFNYSLYTGSHVLCVCVCVCVYLFFYFFMTRNLTKAEPFWTHPWTANPRYMTPPTRTVYRVIQEKLLVGIEPRMFESTAHPKPPTN